MSWKSRILSTKLTEIAAVHLFLSKLALVSDPEFGLSLLTFLKSLRDR